jgi:heme exporter protein D
MISFFKNSPYNMFTMSAQDWAAFTLTLLSIVTLVATGVKWLVKHYFEEIKSELRPNSGSSLKDQVTRLESRSNEIDQMTRDMDAKLDKMYLVLLDHISRNNK